MGKKGPDFRFEKIEQTLSDLNIDVKQNHEHHGGHSTRIETRLENTIFELNSRLQKVETMFDDILNLKAKSNKLQDRITTNIEDCKDQIL